MLVILGLALLVVLLELVRLLFILGMPLGILGLLILRLLLQLLFQLVLLVMGLELGLRLALELALLMLLDKLEGMYISKRSQKPFARSRMRFYYLRA